MAVARHDLGCGTVDEEVQPATGATQKRDPVWAFHR
jgi:hypothetical protein